MRKIYCYEPFFFIFFGLFHVHRVWAFLNRQAYADFWIGILKEKGFLYFLIMGILGGLSILGVVTFLKNRKDNYWWRWIYLFGGAYLLIDLFAIATELEIWNRLLLYMFDVHSSYWDSIWLFFILIGLASFILGLFLLYAVRENKQSPA